MLFEGNTLTEVFHKAFGRPLKGAARKPYGSGKLPARKIPLGKPQSKPHGFGKQEAENPHGTREAIARAREQAVRDASIWIDRADINEGAAEAAIIYIYDRSTGVVRTIFGSSRGSSGSGDQFSTNDRHFSLTFNIRRGREIILATAHSHPKHPRRTARERQRASGADRRNEGIGGNRDDLALRRMAPLVIKTPTGRVRPFYLPGGYD